MNKEIDRTREEWRKFREARAVYIQINAVFTTVPMIAAYHRDLVAAMDFLEKNYGPFT
jgi:hypothetical protein